MKTLESRLVEYNKHFGFKENPEEFNFNICPIRRLYKNEALRTGNRDLYARYLAENYPIEMGLELSDFDRKAQNIVKMNKNQVQAYMAEKGYNLLKGDLHFIEQDGIFHGVIVDYENLIWDTARNFEDLINPVVHVGDTFNNKEWIWIIKN
ncbi:hypothetical protein [Sphingobacterium bovistauri]|uniref:SUKH-3 immunity protein n=1 Tax=Sphingobacterium bovistauri TaxID=2781959 RepID=A0ABS7Z9G5_9SPHI|nr:hypothetical protein [Sphingobacterium bovistauri]MCA5006832.1 hypothetical protein [Sphingobacterium bovistauri]